MMQKIRVAMGSRDERYKLSGFTEMDEEYFTMVESATVGEKGKKNRRGRGSDKQTPVLVMAQTEHIKNPKNHRQHYRCKFFKMRVMPDLKSETINQVVKDSVNPKTNDKTDGLLGY